MFLSVTKNNHRKEWFYNHLNLPTLSNIYNIAAGKDIISYINLLFSHIKD